MNTENEDSGWGVLVLLNTPRNNGSDVEVITFKEEQQARDLCEFIEKQAQLLGRPIIGKTNAR